MEAPPPKRLTRRSSQLKSDRSPGPLIRGPPIGGHCCSSPPSSVEMKPPAVEMDRRKAAHGSGDYVLVIFAASVVYMNALQGDFVHDDIRAITGNADVTGESDLASVWKHDFWGDDIDSNSSHKSFRPLTTLTFRSTSALCRWFGAETSGTEAAICLHLGNVVLHVVASCLVLTVGRQVVSIGGRGSTVAALFFAVHPVHAEAVTSLVGRADVLSGVFFALSLIYFQRSQAKERRGWMLLALLMSACSMLSKEQGITSLAVCFLLEFIRFKRFKLSKNPVQDSAYRLISIMVFASALVCYRWKLMGGQLPTFTAQDNPAAFHHSPLTRLLSRWYLYACNIRLLILPTTLSHDWSANSIGLVSSICDGRNMQSLLCLALIFALIRSAILSKQPDVLLSCALFLLPFLPAANLFFTVGFVLAERVLYLPSMGFCLLIGCGYSRLRLKRKHIVVMFIVISLGARTLIRNPTWASRKSLTIAGLQALPHNAKLNYNFANLLKDNGQLTEAIYFYKEALRFWPHYPSAHNNLGTLLNENMTEAEAHYRMALDQAPCHSNAYFNLGQLLFSNGKADEGIRSLHLASECDPKSHLPHVQLGLAYSILKNLSAAIEHFSIAHQLQPQNTQILYNMAHIQATQGQNTQAIRSLEHCLEIDSEDLDCLQLSSTLFPLSKVKHNYLRSIEAKPKCWTLLQAAKFFSQTNSKLEFLQCVILAQTQCAPTTNNSLLIAKLLYDVGYVQRALDALQKADRHDVRVVMMMANIHGSIGQHSQAIAVLNERLESNSSMENGEASRVHAQIGKHYKDMQEWDHSLNHFQIAVQMNEDDVDSQHHLAIVLHSQGKLDEALVHYEIAKSLMPSDNLISRNHQKLLRQMQSRHTAKKTHSKIESGFPRLNCSSPCRFDCDRPSLSVSSTRPALLGGQC